MTKKEKAKYRQFLHAHNGDEQSATHTYVKWKCLTDLYFLSSEVLGLRKATEGQRKRWDPRFHRWMAKILERPHDTLLLVPRGHMKSTMVKVRIVQMILQNPMIRIGLFSRTSGLVEEQLNDIKNMLQTSLLRHYFPDLIPDPGKRWSGWQRATANELTLKRDPEWGRIPQESQVEAWGAGATITGRHYDVVVFDDILNEQSCSTPEQIRKVRDFYSYVQSIKEPDGFEYVIGTRYHYGDLYGTIIKENWFGNRVFVRSAIEDGKPIYSFFTLKMLDKIKKRQGPFEWSCQYMNNPVPADFQIFAPPQPMYAHLPEDRYDYYITVDPAATTEKYSDETAIAVGAVNQKGILYVLEANGHKLPPNEVAEVLISKMEKYRPKKVGIELGLQSALKYVIDSKLSEYYMRTGTSLSTHFEPIKISRVLSKENRINRSLGAFVREGKIFLHESLNDLFMQMEFFPRGEHDDLVDAVSMLFQVIDKFSGQYWNGTSDAGKTKTFYDLFAPKSVSGSWEDKFAV